MDAVAGIQTQARAALSAQKKREEALNLKVLILTIDKFVQGLVSRLENPNKSWIGSPSPPVEGDMKYNSCVKSIQARIGNVLVYRSLYGNYPPQYETLKKILEKTIPSRSPKDKYNEPKIEFLYRFKQLFLIIMQGGDPDCKSYVRILNLFISETKSDEYHFDYKDLYAKLDAIIRKVDLKIEMEQVKEEIEMVTAELVLEAKKNMPNPPGKGGRKSYRRKIPNRKSRKVRRV